MKEKGTKDELNVNREYWRMYYQEHREQKIEAVKKWQKANPDKVLAYRKRKIEEAKKRKQQKD